MPQVQRNVAGVNLPVALRTERVASNHDGAELRPLPRRVRPNGRVRILPGRPAAGMRRTNVVCRCADESYFPSEDEVAGSNPAIVG